MSHEQTIINFVQVLLNEENPKAITPTLISERIDKVITGMNPKWGVDLDRQFVTDELIRRFSFWIGQDSTLKDNVGHVDWLVSGRKKDWSYWQRYRDWQEQKLSLKAADGLDRSTDQVLSMLEDPTRAGSWDRRGLVVGHVQSGKTGHYIGLINKAADAGYKIIIVLAGMHNNLRAQTQMRLDEGFLGYETKAHLDDTSPAGVGLLNCDPSIAPNCATTRADTGDFNTRIARNFAITPEARPWLFVVKKNKTVLARLLQWIRNHVANVQESETGRKIVANLPLLIIDDEADHASVDTGEQVFDSDGNPDEEHQPKAINSLIRRIIHSFARSAYVGYTATPFANIFIHDRGETREEGPDLFPSSFIISLAAQSDYIGPAKVFGLPSEEGNRGGLPLIRTIDDHTPNDSLGGWMPQRHRNGHIPLYEGQDMLPPSLREAIDAFVLSCAVRQLRGQKTKHASMLVHVTRFNSVQKNVYRQVDERIQYLRQRLTRGIGHEDLIANLRKLWERDYLPTSERIQSMMPDSIPRMPLEWKDLADLLPDVISDIHVRMINGTAKDSLNYTDHESTGLKVIAIGGDKLARGLTLEGLSVSYFLRASRMYDTLMQMGRWFGYRPGYLDLCRLYTTTELTDWFGHISEAAEELRDEFDFMAASGATPREYGLKVQSHSVLMVTSRLKMRSAKSLMLSFSGQLLETVALYRDIDKLQCNLDSTISLISALGGPEIDPIRDRNGSRQQWKGYLWKDVPVAEIVSFLSRYRTHPEAHKVNSALLVEFIESMARDGELTNWTVALIGGGEGGKLKIRDDITINMLKRVRNGDHNDRYSIGRLMSSRDEAIDLDNASWDAALAATLAAWHTDPARNRNVKEEPTAPSGPAIRKIRGFGTNEIKARPDRGVLLLYALDPQKAEAGFSDDTPPIIAFGISFPGSNSGNKVEYKINNVLWEQDYGSAE